MHEAETGVLVDTHTGSKTLGVISVGGVNGDGTVNAENLKGSGSHTSIPYVAVGGSAPTTGWYFQATA